jgi:hypothetical protein
MNLLFYIDWRAFNIGKQKGYFLENILLLMSARLFAFLGFILIQIEWLFELNIRKYLFDIRSENTLEKLFGIIFTLFISFLIFQLLKSYYTKNNKYQKIIKEYDIKYKDTSSYIFLLLFLLITFACFFSLWFAGIMIS